jgi:predicted membrane chloride channel (bestrophin family)
VAREVQDPFGFDENDLNVQGYEISTIENVSVMINGPLRVRTHNDALCPPVTSHGASIMLHN